MPHRDHPSAVASKGHTTRRFEELGPVEVLALALHIERANARRYRAFADSFHGYDDEVAQGFDELAAAEYKHEVLLVSVFKERFGESIPTVDEPDVDVVIESVDLDDAEHQIFASLELRRVFELALRSERVAYTFYERAASAAKDSVLTDLYQELAAMEDAHVKRVEARLNELDAQGGAW